MAKARNKGKNEEQKGDNSEAVIRHQKLCLSIDMDKRRIYGCFFLFFFTHQDFPFSRFYSTNSRLLFY